MNNRFIQICLIALDILICGSFALELNKNKKLRVNFQRVQEELIYQEHLSNEFIAKLFELDFD